MSNISTITSIYDRHSSVVGETILLNGLPFLKNVGSSFYLNAGILGCHQFFDYDPDLMALDVPLLYQSNSYNFSNLLPHVNALAEYNFIYLGSTVEDYISSIQKSKNRWELNKVFTEALPYNVLELDTNYIPSHIVDSYYHSGNTQPLIYELLDYIPGAYLVSITKEGNIVAYVMVRQHEGVFYYLGSFILIDVPLGNIVAATLIEYAISKNCQYFDFVNIDEGVRTKYKSKFYTHSGYVPVVTNIVSSWLVTEPSLVSHFVHNHSI